MRRHQAVFTSLCLAAVLGALVPALSFAQDGSCVFTVSMVTGTDVNNLDYTVNYTGAAGEIEGSGKQVKCVNALGGAVTFFNDDDNGQLKASMIRLTYFSAPKALSGCRFLYDSLEPSPADFGVTVINAGRDGSDQQLSPLPVLQVTKVECPGDLPQPTTTTTTIPEITTTTLPGEQRCGFPVTDGAKPAASDALRALRVAVGNGECDLCVCDVNDNGGVTTTDALVILRAAVGLDVSLDCPPC
jgi:hypothetical protein